MRLNEIFRYYQQFYIEGPAALNFSVRGMQPGRACAQVGRGNHKKGHPFEMVFLCFNGIVAATYFTRFDPSIIGGSGLGAPGLTSLLAIVRSE